MVSVVIGGTSTPEKVACVSRSLEAGIIETDVLAKEIDDVLAVFNDPTCCCGPVRLSDLVAKTVT
jgi:hypothetical protein